MSILCDDACTAVRQKRRLSHTPVFFFAQHVYFVWLITPAADWVQVSEISLFFVARAQHLKLIRRHHYLMAVATTIILMVASPLVIKGLQAIHGGAAFGSGGPNTSPHASPRVGSGGSAGSASGGGGLPGGDHEESGPPSRAERGSGKGGGKDGGGKGRARGESVDTGSGENAAGEAEGQRRLRFRRAVPE